MCRPDVSSLATFFWDDSAKPKVNGTKTLHSCVDWDTMMASMRERVVSVENLEGLENPLLKGDSNSPTRM